MKRNITYAEEASIDRAKGDLETILGRLRDLKEDWHVEQSTSSRHFLGLPLSYGMEEVLARAKSLRHTETDISVEVAVAREGTIPNVLTVKLRAEYIHDCKDWYPGRIKDLIAGTGLKLVKPEE